MYAALLPGMATEEMRHLSIWLDRILYSSRTWRPATLALVVAMAWIMLPAIPVGGLPRWLMFAVHN